VGWPLRVREPIETLDPPTDAELALLRDRLDPDKLFLKG
jgi:hypothetical protein